MNEELKEGLEVVNEEVTDMATTEPTVEVYEAEGSKALPIIIGATAAIGLGIVVKKFVVPTVKKGIAKIKAKKNPVEDFDDDIDDDFFDDDNKSEDESTK